MKTLLILLLSTISLLSYSQTKEYYKNEGEIVSRKRSSNSTRYRCVKIGDMAKVNNIKNKRSSEAPLKKDGSALSGDVPTFVTVEDPEIFYKISAKVLEKYGFEICTRKERSELNLKEIANRLHINIIYDSDNGKILEVEFVFFPKEDRYASYLPIEAYEEIETEIKKQVKATVNEEGRTRIFCRQMNSFIFKPKK